MSSSSSNKPRIGWIDFAKGVVIICVVLGHAMDGDFALCKLIYIFHMPFFFITAGYLLNLDKWGGATKFKKFAAKLFKRLLVPYFLAEFLWYPIWFVVCHKAGYLKYMWEWTTFEPLESFTAIFIGNGHSIGLVLRQLWFLPALFLSEIIFVKLFNRLKKFIAEIFLLAVVTCSSFGLIFKETLGLPMGLDIAFVAQIFLLAGVFIRRYNLVERIDLKSCGAVTLIFVFAFYFNKHVDMNFRVYGNTLLFYAGGIAGTLLVMKFSMLMTDGKIFSLISDCGRQSMMILVLHPIILNVAYELLVNGANFPLEKIYTDTAVIFIVTVAGVLIPLFLAKKFGNLPVIKYFCA